MDPGCEGVNTVGVPSDNGRRFLSYTTAEMARTRDADIRVLSVQHADARRLGIMRISPKGYPYISEGTCQVLNAEQRYRG